MNEPGYELTVQVGTSPWGDVWTGHQRTLNRLVTIRLLKPELAAVEALRQAFTARARAAAKLRHRHLVQIYDIVDHPTATFVVEEHVEGLTVEQLVAQRGALPLKQALTLFDQAAAALEAAWTQGQLIHGHLTPADLIVDSMGMIRVSGVGMMRPAEGTPLDQSPDHLAGLLPHYIAPELVDGGTAHGGADMYALGACLYYALTARHPFEDTPPAEAARMQVKGVVPDVRTVTKGLPPTLSPFLVRLLMKHPENRYADWAAVRDIAQKMAAGRAVMQKVPDLAPSTMGSPDALEPRQRLVRRAPARIETAAPAKAPPVPEPSPAPDAAAATTATDAAPATETAATPTAAPAANGPRRTPRPFVQTERPAPPAEAAAAAGVPWHVQAPAWLLLLAWLILLGVKLADMTPFLYPASAIAAVTPVEKAPAPAPAAPAPVIVTYTPAPAEPSENPDLFALKQRVAEQLLAGDSGRALALIQRQRADPGQYPYQDKLDGLAQLVRDIARMNTIVQSAFREKLGKEIQVVYRKKPYSMIPRAMAGDRVNASVRGMDGRMEEKTVTFALSDFDPIERAHWVGQATTPDRSAMKCVLHAQGGDLASARKFAAQSGPLAQALLAALDTYTPDGGADASAPEPPAGEAAPP